jgi:4-hydroxy-3-methylbut-2-enyl diphosphate reductase
VLLGEIIHNPWVNDYFRRRGVVMLTAEQREQIDRHVRPDDWVIVPAFGVTLEIRRRLEAIGCVIIDCSCGDVIRLWRWSEQAVGDGFGVMVFGRSDHDETVVTKSRLAQAGGKYVVAENLEEVRQFARLLMDDAPDSTFLTHFPPALSNADSLRPFEQLAQVSQTTMLYDDTQQVRDILRLAFESRFGPVGEDRLRLQPTVCRATQNRQNAAVELCRSDCDLVMVVGGFGSSNTRHLLDLARRYAPAYLIEDASAIVSRQTLHTWDPQTHRPCTVEQWWPGGGGPWRIGVLAGASSPEVVIGDVLKRLAEFLR